ncbi:MAG: TIR-like protein FxsC, partial [Actinomycetes bacterium]
MNEESFEDPSAPVFFLSYARAHHLNKPVTAPYQVNRHVLRLFQDLSENVNQLLALPSGRDPGFMDLTMSGGEEWE